MHIRRKKFVNMLLQQASATLGALKTLFTVWLSRIWSQGATFYYSTLCGVFAVHFHVDLSHYFASTCTNRSWLSTGKTSLWTEVNWRSAWSGSCCERALRRWSVQVWVWAACSPRPEGRRFQWPWFPPALQTATSLSHSSSISLIFLICHIAPTSHWSFSFVT